MRIIEKLQRRHQRLRQRARALWEKGGRPSSGAEERWEHAIGDIDAEDTKGKPTQPQPARSAAMTRNGQIEGANDGLEPRRR